MERSCSQHPNCEAPMNIVRYYEPFLLPRSISQHTCFAGLYLKKPPFLSLRASCYLLINHHFSLAFSALRVSSTHPFHWLASCLAIIIIQRLFRHGPLP
ncbi:hypothetical protein BO85DRAFT_40444 [Aspergillus piperis CBS 112811]|uniref:Uncharacterized protein n=1 Tax=Aspergillus piperis CBS 112811 TaxID=1448313 RepID=A0A8G1VKG4_9EURO|nr:hypothetical protein BO85DRAFT_40444 [Aspergillus piperis CBS 112811]RAH56749.1 hypothetical protein BO85DRAFT_40444 [Aspergillus piperis CBS 112811]